MNKVQTWRLITRSLFFILFVITPMFDIFRLDLYEGHFYFFGMDWTLGLANFVAGKMSTEEAALHLIFRAFFPIFGVIGTVIYVSWRYGRIYCGWLCPHFSIVETVNQILLRATRKQSIWDRRRRPEETPDGTVVRENPVYWLLFVPVALGFAVVWAVVLLTYLLPPAVVYDNLWNMNLTRNQTIFICVGATLFSFDFIVTRHLFCRYACAPGFFQSLAWIGNKRAMVVAFDRARTHECSACASVCDHACPMRLKPRKIKRLKFTCTQCGECIRTCEKVQAGNPVGSLLEWKSGDEALGESEGKFATGNKSFSDKPFLQKGRNLMVLRNSSG